MKKLKLVIGADHAGYQLKKTLIDYLQRQGHEVKDHGTYTEDSVDYPDFAHPVANDVEGKKADFGILICGSANGISMAANKHKGIRAAVCWNHEVAQLARAHNDANILSLPARFITTEEAEKCIDTFFSTEFEGGRHGRRVDKIAAGC
ncbi:MAG TPA: ribose 5-phosphate isomerase B [Bacteroidia bacterium]|jgi:ribose 5-phosphate isomerase B|nr:ribose 5-phosphate isomerase B [Bacteroidia bacterium]